MKLNNLGEKLKTLESWDFEILVPMHKCDSCEKIKDVELTTDPFNADVNNTDIWMFLCDDCYQQSLMDI